ncbi:MULTISPECIES: MFS transporter [unclassified Paraburkholderia]|uniref:MFS transporter n=1 Tax=unclassified Paraburkholderia TaxID=2615204 RepID=UPI002AB14E66|nr:MULTISPECIES: MFS transporter [unclassified Paraburkholderia]
MLINKALDGGAEVRDAESALMLKIKLRVIPLVIICYLFAWFDRINISFAKFHLQKELALSDTAYGLGAALFVVGYVACEVPSNLFLYRVGPRKWIARIMISWGIATASMVFVRSETQFYVARFIIGAMEAGFAPGVLYYLSTWFPAKHRGRVSGLLFLALAFSGVLGAPLSGFILGHFDGVAGVPAWHWIFLIGGLPCVLLGIIVLFRFDDQVEDATWLSDSEKRLLRSKLDADAKKVVSHSFLGALKSPAFLILAVAYFLVQIASYGMNFWMPQLLRSSGVRDATTIGLYTALPYLVGGIAMVVMGKLGDRSGNRRLVFAACMSLTAIGFLGAGIFAHETLPLVLSLTILGVGMLTTIPAFWTMPPKVVTGVGAAGGIALINSIGQMGGIVSPIMVGRISDLTGSTTPALYAIVALCVLCVAIALWVFPQELRSKDV